MKNQDNTIHQNQRGFASIVIALVMIIVLALVTVGFAKLARHEQQGALDKQLSTQAYYAAESGINDAYNDIQNRKITSDGAPGSTKADNTRCMSPGGSAKTSKKNITADGGISYSCLLVDLTPKDLELQIPKNSDRTLSFSAAGLNDITVIWGSSAGNNDFQTTLGAFKRSGDWHSPAVLQFTIVPIFGNKVLRDQQSFTSYLYPLVAPSSPASPGTTVLNLSQAGQGPIVSGNCSSVDNKCRAKITGLNIGATSYLIHVYDYYDPSDVTIIGNNGTQKFVDGQAKIDVTGRARNVLKRLQVRMPINQVGGKDTRSVESKANFALESQVICKRILSTQVFTAYSAPADLKADLLPWGVNLDNTCNLSSN